MRTQGGTALVWEVVCPVHGSHQIRQKSEPIICKINVAGRHPQQSFTHNHCTHARTRVTVEKSGLSLSATISVRRLPGFGIRAGATTEAKCLLREAVIWACLSGSISRKSGYETQEHHG
jgi:hypothetical protein